MRALLVMFSLVTLALVIAWGSSKPNFSGDWKLNPAKSEFGKSPAPVSMLSHIEHRDPEISVHSEIAGPQGNYSTDYKWMTDGRENVNTVRGNEIRASVVWSGPALISHAKTNVNGVALTIVDRWSLSGDGRTLTIERTVIAPQGNAEQKFVYEK